VRPVVPKIRVGDVLLGTKNLRSWLQTASLLNYVRQVADRYGEGPGKAKLYLPSKKDRFVVAVNAWETFAVWGLDQKVMLLFCNPKTPKSHSTREMAVHPLQLRPGRNEPTMNPSLFAQWFIRTRGKYPDLLSWPEYAYYVWGSLQMNAISSSQARLSLGFNGDHSFPMLATIPHDCGRAVIRERIELAIYDGLTRPKARRVRIVVSGYSYGPQVSDLPRMQEEIRKITSNPRIVKKLKLDENPAIQKVLEKYLGAFLNKLTNQ
jgi:hypothetical protein